MDTYPVNYSLEFEPDLERFTFGGKESVTVRCSKPTDTITMHCAELVIRSCRVESAGCVIKSSYKLDKKREELQIRLGKKIKGDATIHTEFDGILNDRLLGFYRSRYRQGKKTKYLATTQFEAADARRAFPCWDEPAAKATFEITIIADSKFAAISNMPVKSKRKKGFRTFHVFSKTPVMSTYLLYLGVGEFEYISGRTGRTLVRVITTKGNKSKAGFSLDLAKKLLKSYEDYFGIRYPLPKLDLIAVPDFAAGAMENWGAITFRETILLYDPKTSSTRTKQFIAEVISHEIAHQWFGNLVTMKWWNDLWLNESFATFMATRFVDKFYPEWDMWNQFIEDAMNTAMSLDSLKTTHPIDVRVDSPSQIREIFDAISYDKGGCVLRMLEKYVGEPGFRRGLKKYLSDFKYANAEGADLWDAIGKATGMPVSKMVSTWLRQPGFPLVAVEQKGALLKFTQKRYLLEREKKSAGGMWSIPLSFGFKKTETRLFDKKSMTARAPKGVGLVANIGRHGFYRVKYDAAMLLDLKMMVDQKRIGPVDRWAVQNDLFSLCISGDEKIRSYLDFTDAYCDEDIYLPSVNVAHNLASLYNAAHGEKFAGQIRVYAANYLKTLLSRIGWDPRKSDPHTDALLRSFVISALGRMNDKSVTAEALKRYQKFLKSPGSLHPDLVEAVCSIAAWNGDTGTYSQLQKLYKNAKTTEEKLRFLGAMCGFSDKRLLAKSLDFSLGAAVRTQNMQLPILKTAANPHGSSVLWPWLKKNWKNLDKKIGHGNPLFNRIIACLSVVRDDSMEREFAKFFKKNTVPGTERTQQQTAERLRIRRRLRQNMRAEFG
ncbi:MAG: M1 family peptidase [Nitrosopumilus sp. H13]|nr:MAG: M1 family peptidase [Nitrosopumilus sp. H13]